MVGGVHWHVRLAAQSVLRWKSKPLNGFSLAYSPVPEGTR